MRMGFRGLGNTNLMKGMGWGEPLPCEGQDDGFYGFGRIYGLGEWLELRAVFGGSGFYFDRETARKKGREI